MSIAKNLYNSATATFIGFRVFTRGVNDATPNVKSAPPNHGSSQLCHDPNTSAGSTSSRWDRSPACFPQHEKQRGGGQLLSAQSHDSTQAETGGWGGGLGTME